jgi:hypothetical protein
VSAVVDGSWVRWTVRGPAGPVLADRRVEVVGDGVELGAPERDGDGGRCAIRAGKGTVAVTDVDSGTTALVEVR